MIAKIMSGRIAQWLAVTTCAFACLVLSGGADAQDADRRAEIRGFDMGQYGRIIMSFDRLPQTEIALRNGIITLRFDRAVAFPVERLTVELQRYIAGARLDPDGKALRLALADAAKFNLQDAGHDLYLDLLPKTFTGANPPLPVDVVRELSRRVRDAEAELRARDKASEQELQFEGGENAAISVLKISPVEERRAEIRITSPDVRIRLDGRYRADQEKLRRVLPKGVKLVNAVQEGRHFVIGLDADASMKIRSYFVDGVLTLEFARERADLIVPDDLDAASRGAVTGSVGNGAGASDSVPDGPTDVSSNQIRVGMRREGDINRLEIAAPDPVTLSVFADHRAVFVVMMSPHPLVMEQDSVAQSGLSVTEIETGNEAARAVMVTSQARLMPAVLAHAKGYTIALGPRPADQVQNFDYVTLADERDQARTIVSVSDASSVISFDNPETGVTYRVVPSAYPSLGMREPVLFQEFEILASAQGVAIRKIVDDLVVNADAGALVITRPQGLVAVSRDEGLQRRSGTTIRSVIRAQNYSVDPQRDVLGEIRTLNRNVIMADPKDRATERWRLARLYAAHELYREAAATLELAFKDRVPFRIEAAEQIELDLYRTLSGSNPLINTSTAQSDSAGSPDAALLAAYRFARQGQMSEAVAAYRSAGNVLASYPSNMVRRIVPVLAEAAIEAPDTELAANLVSSLKAYVTPETEEVFRYLAARYLHLTGQRDEALGILKTLSVSTDRSVAVRARLSLAKFDDNDSRDALLKRIAAFNEVGLLWHGDWIEAQSTLEIAKLAFKAGEWRRGFVAMQAINRHYADLPGARTLLDTATRQLETVFDKDTSAAIGSIDAVALFLDFREFMPVGRRGDDLIRKLSDRLVELDLVAQAADLLKYQIDNRLEGAARTAAAPRLAYLLLRDKRPKDALQVLNETRMNGMPDDVNRARLLLEARARADLGDTEGALELVATLSGDDVDRLRAEMAWRAQDWKTAAELSELVIGQKWQSAAAFDDELAQHGLRAAIGFALTGDRLALDRIRGRFMKSFESRPDAAAFRFLTAPTARQAAFDSEYALSMKGGNTIDSFLTFYRQRYLQSETTQNAAGTTPG